MKLLISGVFALGLLSVASVTHAQSVDYAAITQRMQTIISEMQALQKEFAGLQASVLPSNAGSTPAFGLVLGAMTTDLQKTVVMGETNDTITKVQKLLATDPMIYPDGTVSGFFGPKTEEALKALQSRFGMKQVGVVGPETAALLAGYFAAHPDENYPADVLKNRPKTSGSVLGASANTPQPAPVVTTPAPSLVSTPLEAIYLTKDSGEVVIRVVYKDGKGVGVVSESTDEADIVKAITKKTGLTSTQVTAVLDMSDLKSSRSNRDDEDDDEDEDYNEEDADDALNDAEDAIDEAADDIEVADDEGADVDEAEELLEEAEEVFEEAEEAFDDEDYEDAYDLAKDARSLARDAVRAIED